MVDACTSDDLAATVAATTEGSAHPATADHAPKPALPGVVIGRYVVLSQLGAGAMGVVYAAYDPELDRKVGLKVLLPGTDRATSASRLLREAQALAKLSHPNVVAVYDVGTHDGQVFLAMEFIAGQTLTTVLRGQPLRRALELFLAAGEGLAAAHRAGLVHRDFKPENVMVDTDGRVRVLDFGLAQAAAATPTQHDIPGDMPTTISASFSAISAKLTATGALMGTPAYMAPEQYLGHATDARCDIFAFCVALYEHLYGLRPFAGNTVATLAGNVVTGKLQTPTRSPPISALLRKTLRRGLASFPEDRPQTLDEVLTEIRRELARPRRRRLAIAAGAVAVTLTVAVTGLLHMSPSNQQCRPSSDLIHGIWSAQARETGAQAFAATGRGHATVTWTYVDRELSAWGERWARDRDDACLATHVRGEASEALLDRRIACFDGQLAAFEGLIDVFTEDAAATVDRAAEAVANLPTTHNCSAQVVLASGDGPAPPPPELAPAVELLQRRFAAADARFDALYTSAAADALVALVDEARTLHRPLVAPMAGRAAHALHQVGQLDRAEALFVDSLSIAEAVGDTWTLAQTLPHWLHFLAKARTALAEAERTRRRAEAVLERVGGDDATMVRIFHARALLAVEVGDLEEAARMARAGLEIGSVALGRDALLLADLHNNLASYIIHSDPKAAHFHIERATEIWNHHLGPSHPKHAFVLARRASVAELAEDYERAETLYRATRARFVEVDPNHPNIAMLDLNITAVLGYRGQLADSLATVEAAVKQLAAAGGQPQRVYLQAQIDLAAALLRSGDPANCERATHLFLAVSAAARKLLGDDHPTTVKATVGHLRGQLATGDAPAAAHQASQLWARLSQFSDDKLYDYADELPHLVRPLLAVGHAQAALPLAERSLVVAERWAAKDKQQAESIVALPKFVLARTLTALAQQPTRARELAEAAHRAWQKLPVYHHRELAEYGHWQAGLDTPRNRQPPWPAIPGWWQPPSSR